MDEDSARAVAAGSAQRCGGPELRLLVSVGLVLAFLAWGAIAQDVAPAAVVGDVADAALSPRNANYEIDVRLDHESRMLHGSQTLTWTNLQEKPTNRLCPRFPRG